MESESRPVSVAGSLTLLLVACLTIMVGCAIVPGLPSIAPALGLPDDGAWLVTLPSLGVVLFGSAAGRAIAKVGAHRALCYGLVAYAALGFGAVLLRGPVAVFSDRILLGGATAIVMAAGTTLISEFFTGQARMVMIARQGMAIELGGVVFLMLGGTLTHLGWAAPFALYLVALLVLMMVVMFIPRQHQVHRECIPPREHIGVGNVKPALAVGLLSMLCFFTAVIALPVRLASGIGEYAFSESEVGYFLSFVSLVAVFIAGTMPLVVEKIGEARTLATAFAAYSIAHMCFAFAGTLSILFAGALFLGCGFGLSVPLANHITIERSSAASRGQNLAYLSVAIFSGQFASSVMELFPSGSWTKFGMAAIIAGAASIAFSRTHLKHRVVRKDMQSADN